jgi:hypothetical protein
MKLVWHYTTEHAIADILRCGYVDVARLFVIPPEKAVAWFSADQYFERTVRKLAPSYGSMQEMLRKGIKLYRIGVLPEAAPLNWTAIRKQSGMSGKTARLLVENSKLWGASPWDWYGSFSPVLESQWQAVETFNNGWEKSPEQRYGKSGLDDGQTQMSSLGDRNYTQL